MELNEVVDGLLESYLEIDPIHASMLGMAGYEAKLPDFSAAGEARIAAALRALAVQAEGIDTANLSESERQTLDFLLDNAAVFADATDVPMLEWTIGDFHGAPVTSVITTLPEVPIDSPERWAGHLERLAGLPNLLETAADRHRAGLEHGRPGVKRLITAAVAQLDLILADRDLGGLARTGAEAAPYLAAQTRIIDTALRPALTRYREVLQDELLAHSRSDDEPGLCAIADGDAYYRALSRLHTSTARDPESLHQTGLDIVEQVNEEFREIGNRLWGLSEVPAIFERLREDPKLRYRNEDEMLAAARATVRRAEEAAPAWFLTVPDEPCLVEPVPESQQAGSAPAYYLSGALDGSRQGTFFINTSRPTERFRHMAETVAYHEAVPGHHFQITIGLRETDLPLGRRIIRDTVCSEGWGLYAERLGDEMGLYSGDVARLGMLSADVWRAGRLVVDTGLHAMGWSRQQAVDWLRVHTPLAPVEIESEINRYITYPAQALSYMVGRVELIDMRQRAEQRLGARFDLRRFHDFVLRVGTLPLHALSLAVDRWIIASAASR